MIKTIWKKLRQKNSTRWALNIIIGWCVLAILADVICNDLPIYCRLDDGVHFPAWERYRLADDAIFNQSYQNATSRINALIPYNATRSDIPNACVSPFANQNINNWPSRHWLGTYNQGKDVFAGIIKGSQVALLVGFGAILIALALGLVLGGIAGYYGDQHLQISRIRLIINMLILPIAVFYAFLAMPITYTSNYVGMGILGRLLLFVFIFIVINLIINQLPKSAFWRKPITIPADLIILRLIEVKYAIPIILLLFALLNMVQSSSVWLVAFIIGLVEWTSIARYFRAELLRIRNLEYIEAARATGISEWRILWHHALPNAFLPILVQIAFGIAAAILMEASLSFLGLGTNFEQVSWGKMLDEARQQSNAWWAVLFPSMALCSLVLALNIVAQGIQKIVVLKENVTT